MKASSDIPIVIATTNQDKMKEYKDILKKFKLLNLHDIGFEKDVEETGKTFDENAYIKAKTVYEYIKEKKLNVHVLSDDSGLVVKSLKGEPGIYSARFSGENATYQSNRDLLLKRMEKFKYNFQRIAYLTTHICLITNLGKVCFTKGKTYGRITKEEIGDKTFGYNCIFYSFTLRKTFGEANINEKRVNHRYKAARKVLKFF